MFIWFCVGNLEQISPDFNRNGGSFVAHSSQKVPQLGKNSGILLG